MLKETIWAAAFAVAISLNSAVYAGPFGLEMGMTVPQLEKLTGKLERRKSKMTYASTIVPKRHGDFESYSFVVSPTVGLCRIRAIGLTVVDDAYGTELIQRFDHLRDQLTEIYGNSQKYSYLRQGSIWDEPREWMMALVKKERVLSAYWIEKKALAFKDGIEGIGLQAIGLDSTAGYLVLEYDFKNISTCISEAQSADSQAL